MIIAYLFSLVSYDFNSSPWYSTLSFRIHEASSLRLSSSVIKEIAFSMQNVYKDELSYSLLALSKKKLATFLLNSVMYSGGKNVVLADHRAVKIVFNRF